MYKPSMQPLLRSYLLRIWRLNDDPHRYRMLLENSMTGERKGFSNILEFSNFLIDQIESDVTPPSDGPKDDEDQE